MIYGRWSSLIALYILSYSPQTFLQSLRVNHGQDRTDKLLPRCRLKEASTPKGPSGVTVTLVPFTMQL